MSDNSSNNLSLEVFFNKKLYQTSSHQLQHFIENLTFEECFKELISYKKQRNLLKIHKRPKWLKPVPFRVCNQSLIEKTRRIIYQLRESGYKLCNIASQLNLSLSQIEYVLQNKHHQQLKSCYFIFAREHKKWIENALIDRSKDVGKKLYTQYELFLDAFHLDKRELSLSRFRKILNKKLRIKYKLAQQYDRRSVGKQQIQARFDYSIRFLSLNSNGFNFLFVDETSLGHQSRPQRYWQAMGQRKIRLYQRSENICVLETIGTKGFVSYQIVIGNVNSKVYSYHLEQLKQQIQNFNQDELYVIVLDNSAVHHSKVTKQILNSMEHCFLPPYSPQLNPIEKVRKSMKELISKLSDQLVSRNYQQIHNYFNSLNERSVAKYSYSFVFGQKKDQKDKNFEIYIQKVFQNNQL